MGEKSPKKASQRSGAKRNTKKTKPQKRHREKPNAMAVRLQQANEETGQQPPQAAKPYRDWHDKWMLILVFFAFVAAAAAAGFTWWQADIAKETAAKELRAYVFVRSYPRVNGVSIDGLPHTNIIFRNAGQTPASKVVVAARLQTGDKIVNILPPERLNNPSEPPLDPRSEVQRAVKVTISEIARKTLWLMDKSGDWKFILSGDVSYQDVFGTNHRAHFCFLYVGLIDSPDGGKGSPFKSNCPHPEDY